jgi:cytochrome c-type biogenesis protein CcmF
VEHLVQGILGQWSIVIAFGAALYASIAYYFSVQAASQADQASWKKWARISFGVSSLALLNIVLQLFIIIQSHYFEYHYAWAHSSLSLPAHFMISCFWEGQEGSFLLWAFWQMVLAWLVIAFNKKWESPVLVFILLSQTFLLSMLLGVEILGAKIGSSPFILLKDAIDAPIFKRPDYLSFIKDGNGLNPLLQNYWMVIHPPTLFLGFASCVIPFAFAMAGVWTRAYKEWIIPALKWSLFAAMILGAGIIMGSFWAYEALNFGGFWAWDPVENASIIPWLTLIAGVHVLIVFKKSGHAFFTALFLSVITFILVLYASFLTRSGILGETSVHAFTDLGMSGQLVIYILFFIVLATSLFIIRWKEFPISTKDEATYSREFWLFIGSLIILISCFQIVLTTSIPVFNALFGTNIAPPINVIQHYNKWQIPIAVLIVIVSGFSQFLKFKDTPRKPFLIRIGLYFAASIVLSIPVLVYTEYYVNIQYALLIIASIFSILTNAQILSVTIKGSFRQMGSALGHIGFAMLLVGALIAAGKSEVLSVNKGDVLMTKALSAKENQENVLLFENEPTSMGGYLLTYTGDTTEGPNTYFVVNYKKIDGEGIIKENFNLYPNAQINPKMGLIASPDTRHYLFKDIYTHVTSVPKKPEHEESDENHQHDENEGYNEPVNYALTVGDSVQLNGVSFFYEGIERVDSVKNLKIKPNDVVVAAKLAYVSGNEIKYLKPVYVLVNGYQFGLPLEDEALGLKFYFSKIDPKSKQIELQVLTKKKQPKDYIIMKAIVFPFINVYWVGAIIMTIGFLISIFKREKSPSA